MNQRELDKFFALIKRIAENIVTEIQAELPKKKW